MKGHRISYSDAELAWVREHAGIGRREAHAAFVAEFSRPDVALTNYVSLCKRNGWFTGRTGHFRKGQEPPNKGRSMPYHPNSAATRFKTGQLPHNTKYLGHERVSKDGYVEVSVAETNPHTGYERRYVLKHVQLWQQANGPVSKGMCLKCLDGDKTNCDPSNWEAVPRALLPRLNGRWNGLAYDNAPKEIRPAILAIAKLHHRTRELRRGSRKVKQSG